MSTKSPECWASDPNARAVKIEVSAEQSLLLPFDQFAFAELKNEGKEQRLRLVFATHEVLIRGHSLRRIETGIQRMELSFLMALPVWTMVMSLSIISPPRPGRDMTQVPETSAAKAATVIRTARDRTTSEAFFMGVTP